MGKGRRQRVVGHTLLETSSRWLAGESNALETSAPLVEDVLKEREVRTNVVRALFSIHQTQRLARLLKFTSIVENRLFSEESLNSLEPKDLLRALQLLHSSVAEAKEFVYDDPPAVADPSEAMRRKEATGKVSLSPAERERIYKVFQPFLRG